MLHALKLNPDSKNLDKNIRESESVDDDSDHVEKKKQGRRKSGRPAKKRARGLGEIDDFASPVSVDVRESALPLKFKFQEEADDKEDKTELEMEIHRLFDDLEVGLWESESLQAPDSCVVRTLTFLCLRPHLGFIIINARV